MKSDIVTLESGLFLESAISVSTLIEYSRHIEPYVIKNTSMVHFNNVITFIGFLTPKNALESYTLFCSRLRPYQMLFNLIFSTLAYILFWVGSQIMLRCKCRYQIQVTF